MTMARVRNLLPGLFIYVRHSFALRLLLIYLAIFAISTAFVVGIAFWTIVQQPRTKVEALVTADMKYLARLYIVDGREALVAALNARAASSAAPRPFHAFIAPDGTTVAANLPSWPSIPRVGFYEIEADRYHEGSEVDYEALSVDRVFADGARLVVGRDIEDIADRREWLLDALAWAAGIAVLLGSIGGVFMSVAVGQRLDSISQAARRVIGGDLSGRVEQKGTGDDFDRLAETLNLMLSRIETSVEAISRVSDSIAHELRLPLTRLHADLEDLAEAAGDDTATRPLIQQAMTEALRLRSVFESLLRIARIETGRHQISRRPLDLSALITDALELYQPETERKALGIECDIPPALNIEGDADLLFQAVSNLLDNAVKYTPDKGLIRVSATVGDMVRVRIENEGPGIAPEHRDRVTERFYRTPDAASLPGLGLGLSLVQAVIQAHGGRLTFVDTPNGFAADLHLPA
ncbi:MAG: HAMP domain-containing protein [Alphaproteobacteria bacterium]|nr:MAG: HAMP domain-containing protein [Alphaproteobacteria bacterium]